MKLIQGDCLKVLPTLPSNSVDMVLCDLPYGITACKWDVAIPLDALWLELKRIVKLNGAIVLFASQPFSSIVVSSNLAMFRYEWIYQKVAGSNFVNAKKMPIKAHENILVFYEKQPTYHPQMQERSEGGKKRLKTPYITNSKTPCEVIGQIKRNVAEQTYNPNLRLPGSVQKFNNRARGDRGLHPTQKPVELCAYLIKTYTDAGNIVLDCCMGSGTTGVACRNLNRDFIGIEKEQKYYDIAVHRLGSQKWNT